MKPRVLGAYIHASCASDADETTCPACFAELATFGHAELLHNLDGSHTIEYTPVHTPECAVPIPRTTCERFCGELCISAYPDSECAKLADRDA